MTPEDFDARMTAAGYVSTEVRAVVLRVAERTVEGYMGGREIPGPVAKLVEVLAERNELRALVRRMERRVSWGKVGPGIGSSDANLQM